MSGAASSSRFFLALLAACLACSKASAPTEPSAITGAVEAAPDTRSRQDIAAPARSSRAPSAVYRRAAESLPPGSWGGPSVNLKVTAGGGTIEFDCGFGTIDSPILLDSSGRFDVAGTFLREGGPVSENAPRIPARYGGSTDGKTMVLTINTGGFTIGPLSLVLGTETRLVKCL